MGTFFGSEPYRKFRFVGLSSKFRRVNLALIANRLLIGELEGFGVTGEGRL